METLPSRDYFVMFHDAAGKVVGFYAVDRSSGGYPYIVDYAASAESMTLAAATDVVEQCWTNTYINIPTAAKASVCKRTWTVELEVGRESAADFRRTRLIAEARAEVEEAQAKLEALIRK